MKKDIKPYLPFYIGCECETKWGVKATLLSVWNPNADYIPRPICKILRSDAYGVTIDIDPNDFTLSLRKLSSMTEEERNELRSLQPAGEDMFWLKNLGMPAHFLLSRGFDLFGLIEEGLAIEKTTVGGEQ